MTSFGEKTSFISELFKERQLRPLKATQQQMQIAKQSLIYKKKSNSNVHSILFCKTFAGLSSQFTTQNEKKILDEQKSKYFEYVRKTFKDKIPEDFESQNKLKRALKNKILQKREIEASKNPDQTFKRRKPAQVSKQKDKKTKIMEQKGSKKLKKSQQENEKKIIADEQEIEKAFEEGDSFQSQIDMHNDEIDESYGNDDNQF